MTNKLSVPYFKQEKETTCGVACLRMVLAFYGKEISEYDLEDVCETGWMGNTCGELVAGIEKCGFEADEFEHADLDYLTTVLAGNMPLIALLDPAVLYGGLEGFGHYVVIVGIDDEKVWYHDPGLQGDVARSVPEFMEAWKRFSLTGVRVWKGTAKR